MIRFRTRSRRPWRGLFAAGRSPVGVVVAFHPAEHGNQQDADQEIGEGACCRCSGRGSRLGPPRARDTSRADVGNRRHPERSRPAGHRGAAQVGAGTAGRPPPAPAGAPGPGLSACNRPRAGTRGQIPRAVARRPPGRARPSARAGWYADPSTFSASSTATAVAWPAVRASRDTSAITSEVPRSARTRAWAACGQLLQLAAAVAVGRNQGQDRADEPPDGGRLPSDDHRPGGQRDEAVRAGRPVQRGAVPGEWAITGADAGLMLKTDSSVRASMDSATQ